MAKDLADAKKELAELEANLKASQKGEAALKKLQKQVAAGAKELRATFKDVDDDE